MRVTWLNIASALWFGGWCCILGAHSAGDLPRALVAFAIGGPSVLRAGWWLFADPRALRRNPGAPIRLP